MTVMYLRTGLGTGILAAGTTHCVLVSANRANPSVFRPQTYLMHIAFMKKIQIEQLDKFNTTQTTITLPLNHVQIFLTR